MDFNFPAEHNGPSLALNNSGFSTEFTDLMNDAVPVPSPGIMLDFSNFDPSDSSLFPMGPYPTAAPVGSGFKHPDGYPHGPSFSSPSMTATSYVYNSDGYTPFDTPGTPPALATTATTTAIISATAFEHNTQPATDADVRVPDASVGDQGDLFSGTSTVMEQLHTSDSEDEVEDTEGRVGKLRERPERTQVQKEKRKISDVVRKERKEKVDQGLEVVVTKIDELKEEFANGYGLSDRIASNLVDGPQLVKGNRAYSVRDAMVSKKFAEVNATRTAGNKAKLPEIQRLVVIDPIFNAMTEAEKMKMKAEFQQEKDLEVAASRPTPLSAAKTADVRLKRIHKELRLLEKQTGVLFVLINTRGNIDSTIRPSLKASPDVYPFFRNILKNDIYNVTRQMEQYGCTLRDGGITHESLTSLRKEAAEMIQGSLDLLSKSTASRIPVRYKDYKVEMREKCKVQVVHWPAGLTIKHPKHFDCLEDLRKICIAFRTGAAYWAPLTPAERKQVSRDITARKERGEPEKPPKATRSDKGKKRGKQAGAREGKQAGAKRKSAGKENPAASKRARVEGRGESSRTVHKSKELVDSEDDEDEVSDENDETDE